MSSRPRSKGLELEGGGLASHRTFTTRSRHGRIFMKPRLKSMANEGVYMNILLGDCKYRPETGGQLLAEIRFDNRPINKREDEDDCFPRKT
ncbi:unnamed protein product [Nesidiocoris tenuis]|uniref:Uncharacterized protein n=1 Tax=Nesidiocoris tenuis TaxID=355587 RepID=A0A6H5GPC9_9HEMI|nr:unnamed protein product [Nesidiocoris tenuis]